MEWSFQSVYVEEIEEREAVEWCRPGSASGWKRSGSKGGGCYSTTSQEEDHHIKKKEIPFTTTYRSLEKPDLEMHTTEVSCVCLIQR
jgi:hypothetical protein